MRRKKISIELKQASGAGEGRHDAKATRPRLHRWVVALSLMVLVAGLVPPPLAADSSEAATRTPVEVGSGKIGVQIGEKAARQFCSELQKDRAAGTVLWLRRGEVDKGNGQYDWTKLDREVNTLRSCGLEVALHVQSRNSPEQPPMPRDLDGYMRFLADLVIHLEGRVRRYSIENEAVAVSVWPDSPESYFQLLDRAYATIKRVDPDAIVLNSGISSSALGIMVANSLYRSGEIEEAYQLLQQVAVEAPGEAGGLGVSIPATESGLRDFFQHPRVKRIVGWMVLEVQHQDSYDAFQFHYYGPWERLPQLVHWIRSQGITKPIEGWELGRRSLGAIPFDETLHAQESARLLVTAVGEGSGFNVFVRYVTWPEKGFPGLRTELGPRPAETAFRIVGEKLNGFESADWVDLGPSVWAYRFTRPQGEMYVIWTTEGTTTVEVPLETERVRVTDITGLATEANSAELIVGESPLFVEEEAGRAVSTTHTRKLYVPLISLPGA